MIPAECKSTHHVDHDSVLANAEPIGNLAVAQPLELVKQQNLPLARRQFVNRAREMIDLILCEQGPLLTGRSIDDRGGKIFGSCAGLSGLIAIMVG